jgi:hypothetical protein
MEHPRDFVAERHDLPAGVAVWYVECTKYESDLKETLGYGEPIYFYNIETVMDKLGLGEDDERNRPWGRVCYLLSNGPLSDEQLLAEVKECRRL